MAANLIGFFEFPYGWTWDEYRSLSREDSASYEENARKTLRDILTAETNTARDDRLITNAKHFRRHRAEHILRKAFDRGSTRIYEGSLAVPDAPSEFGRKVQPLDAKDRQVFRIEESQIGFRQWSRRVCLVDAIDLIEMLESSHEKRGTPKRFDHASIELWLRRSIEACGVPVNGAERIRALQEWYAAKLDREGREPPEKHCRETLTRLGKEYSYVKKNNTFRL